MTARPLWRWQADALPEVLRRDRLALFWEMRLGKTVMTLRWLEARRTPALVVAPLSVCRGWCDEADADGWEPYLARDNDASIAKLLDNHDVPLVVVNYELLSRRPSLRSFPWQAVVLDESPNIRNPQTQRTKTVLSAFRDVPCKAILSGYPEPKSPLDYFTQGQFLSDDGRFMGFSNYWRWRAAVAHQAGPYDWNVPPSSRVDIKDSLRPFALWLTRKQAGLDVPKVRSVRYVPLPREAITAYHEAERDFVVDGRETKWTVAVHTGLRRLCGGDAKVRELVDLATGELRGQPLVVWCYFRDEIKRCVASLREAGVATTYVHGGTGSRLRALRVRSFQSGEVDAIVGQMDCARYGLNLSRSDTIINFSRSWQPESNWQSEDRIIHGDKVGRSVYVLDLVTENTIEEHVREVLFDRRVTSRTFLSRLSARVRRAA